MPDVNLATQDYTGSVRQIVSDEARNVTFDEIPIIDISPWLRKGGVSQQAKADVVDKVKEACQHVGFMYFSGHGLPEELTTKVFEQVKRFFGQSEEDKMEHFFRDLPGFRGYEPMKGSKHKLGDLKEAWNWGYEPAADRLNPSSDNEEFLLKHAAAAKNVWPSDPAMRGFREAAMDYYGEILVLGRQIIRIFALALDLPETFFDDAFAIPGVSGRLLHYPPQPRTEESRQDGTIGIGMHQDIECITLLLQGPEVEALQVLNKRGEWIVAPPIPGTLVVNVGDMLSRWTNGEFVSTPHRVINMNGQERYSLPCFLGPSYDTMIEALPTCIKAGETPKFKPITAGEFSIRRMARSRLGIEYDESISIADLQVQATAARAAQIQASA